MRKKILLLAATIVATMGMATMVSAKTTEDTVKVNEVDSVMISNPASVSNVHNWGSGASSVTDVHKVKFTLTNSAYVKISVSSTVKHENYATLGNVNSPILTTVGGKKLGENIVKYSSVWTDEQYEKYYVLEKGTYYVEYNGKENDGYSEKSSGKVTTTIEAQYVNRTGNVTGTSSKTMILLTNGKASYGYISNLYGEQYFKITFNKKSKVKFDMSIADTPSCFNPEVTYDLVSLGGVSYQPNIKKQFATEKPNDTYYQKYVLGNSRYSSYYRHYPSSGNTGYITLPAGTYYLKIAVNSDEENNVGQIKVTPKVIEVSSNKNNTSVVKTLSSPKLKSYKRNKKKITGTATKGCTVKVKVGKRTYTVKTNNKGKFTVKLKARLKKKQKITIYATMKRYKNSKSKTYKVK